MTFNKILVIDLDRIGDVIRSTFIFRLLRARFPASFIACLAAQPADQLLRNDPNIDMVSVLPHHDIRRLMEEEKTVLHMGLPVFRLLESLKMHEFDLVINPFSEFGALAVRYIRPLYMLGRAMDKQGRFVVYGEEPAKFFYFMSNKKVRSESQCNFFEMYARIVKNIGIEAGEADWYPRVYVSPQDEREAVQFLEAHSETSSGVTIGFQVGAFSRDKMWPIQKFRLLAAQLQKRTDARIVITGSPHEAHTIVREMVTGMERAPIIAAGKTSLAQSAALIKQCNLFVSNDTGPMHIASALGIPIIALFGCAGSIPRESKPWGTSHTLLVKERIEDISVDDVFHAVEEKLRAHQTSPF